MARNNKSSGGNRPRRMAGMAPDAPRLDPDNPATKRAWGRRHLGTVMHSALFVGHYLAFVDEGRSLIPPNRAAPQDADETDEQYQQRRTATQLLKTAQTHAGTWDQLCAEELRRIRPSDAPDAVEWICSQLRTIMAAAGGGSVVDVVAEARLLLDPMCPARHRAAALEAGTRLLHSLIEEGLPALEPSLRRSARREPIATLHFAAAMTAGAYDTHLSGPARTEQLLRLTESPTRH